MAWTAKRFYKNAAVVAGEGGYSVLLDGRPVKTPRGLPLIIPSAALAGAVADEWRAQEQVIRPQAMPLTRLAATARDKVGPARRAVVDQLVSYGDTDLLCYRAEQPVELVARQAVSWQPLVDWVKEILGARLTVTTGVIPVDQPASAIDALRTAVESLGDAELTAMASIVQASGSLVVGLAVVLGRIDGEMAFEISQLDESFQIERWGDDTEALDRRRGLHDDIRSAAEFLALARERTE